VNLRALQWRRIAEGRAKDAAEGGEPPARQCQGTSCDGEAGEPPARPGWGTSDVKVLEDRRSGGGSKRSAG
jgi:hypothetical protein